MQRDTQLDNYRALTMIYIICFIHITYWFDGFGEPYRSYMLFEMPLIFFIAGAAQTYAKPKSLPKMIINRAWRVMFPFYFFMPFLAVLYVIMHLYFPHHTYTLSLWEVVKILFTEGNDALPYYGYTWFISVYLIVMCLFPLESQLDRHFSIKHQLLVNIVLFAIISFTNLPNKVKEIACYNIFFLLGYLYYHKLNARKTIICMVLPTFITCYGFMSGASIPMQDHKFSTDLWFLAFGVTALGWISLIVSNMHIPQNRLLRMWNERGYTIYLYQSFSHFLLFLITKDWIGQLNHPLLKLAVYSSMVFVICTLMSMVTYPMERKAYAWLHHRIGG